MKINELNVIEFGGLSGRSYNLSEGLNIFEGGNETGKSTLWLFIKFMLYGMPKKGHPERERSVSRTTHRASGTMTLTCGGVDYRIERSFADGSRGKVTTYRISDGEQVFVGSEPGEALLGVPREIFDSSVGIGQSACSAMGGEKGAAAIRNILSSADESVDIERIEKRLESVRVLYRHKNGRGGRLYDLSEEINSAKVRLARATEGRLKIVDLENRLDRNTAAITSAEEKLGVLRDTISIMQKQEIICRFDRARALDNEYEKTKRQYELMSANMTVNGEAIGFAQVEHARAQSESFERAKRELETAGARLSELKINAQCENELAAQGEAIQRAGGVSYLIGVLSGAKNKKTAGAAMIVVGAVLAAIFGALSFISLLSLIGVGIALVVAIIGVILAAQKLSGICIDIPSGENPKEYLEKCYAAYEEREALRAELDRAAETETLYQKHYEHIYSSFADASKRIGCEPDIQAVRERITALLNLLEQSGALKGRISELSASIERERQLLSQYDETVIRAELKDRQPVTDDYKAAEEKKRYYEESLKLLKQKDTSLRTELINLRAMSDDPAALNDKISELQKQYDEANDYYEAIVTATEGLRRAAETMRGNVTPIIGRDAAKIVGQITEGRYDGVNMGSDMSVSLNSPDGLTTTYDMMSGGMRDAAYIALRISLMMQIFGGDTPAVMMDEALCQIDDARMKNILIYLSKLCDDGQQVLLFTCHGRESKTCLELGLNANVITLSALA